MRHFFISILLALAFSFGYGQSSEPTKGFIFTPQVSFHKPTGDLDKRFYRFSSVGLGTHFKAKNGLYFGFEYDWMFGNALKEEGTFSNIVGESLQIIDQDGHFSVVRMGIKGHLATTNVGYLWAHNKKNPNSGLLVLGGIGFMQHRIDIISSELKVPQINGEYLKGYDKLTYGFATKQFIGYQYLVRKNRYHFKAGLEFNQGFTQGRRTWDFNSNTSGLDDRFDGTVAFKFGIVLPVYTKDVQDEEFFFD